MHRAENDAVPMLQSLPVGIISVTFMAFMDVVFFFPTTPQTSTPSMNYTVVVLGGVLLLSLVWYYLPVYGGVHWFTGPVSNVDKNDDAENPVSRDSSMVDRKVETVGTVVEVKSVEA